MEGDTAYPELSPENMKHFTDKYKFNEDQIKRMLQK